MKKNFKRTLSVMLVLVMMIPMFVMPADATPYYVAFPSTNYKDVPTTRWSHPYIGYVTHIGLMNGTGNGYFTPEGIITKGELNIVLERLMGSNPVWKPDTKICTRNDIVYAIWQNYGSPSVSTSVLNKYSDTCEIKRDQHKMAWAWCVSMKIIKGTSNTKLSPNGNVTREQFATIITKYHITLMYNMLVQ